LPPIDGLPADVIELCEQCLSKNPDDRPASLYAAVVLADAAGLPVTLPTVTLDPTPVAASYREADIATGALESDLATGPVAAGSDRGSAAGSGSGVAGSAAGSGSGVAGSGAPGSGVADSGADSARPRPRPSLAGHPRLPGRAGHPGRRRVRSHAATEGRRRASERSGALTTTLGRFTIRRSTVLAAVAGLAGLLAATGAYVLPADRAEGPSGQVAGRAGGCAARYDARPVAGNAFTAEVAITNTGAARRVGWSLAFALPGGQRITDAAGVRWNQDGDEVTLRGAVPLEAGDTQRLSLTGTASTAPVPPTRFTLDGASCAPA
jgi:hypothetical protein